MATYREELIDRLLRSTDEGDLRAAASEASAWIETHPDDIEMRTALEPAAMALSSSTR